MRLERVRLIGTLGFLLCCASFVGGCFRTLTDQNIVGTYRAHALWGESTLVLHADHTFEQTVVRNDHTNAKIDGTWKLDMFDGKSKSHGIIVLKPFLDVEHDHKGDFAGGAVPSISRGFFGGITIAADPDYGISFDKE